jgi:hypothetical protein
MVLDPKVTAKVAATVCGPGRRTAKQGEWVQAASTARIAVKLRDGTAWIRECLPVALVKTASWIETADAEAAAAGVGGRARGADWLDVAGAGRSGCTIM